eukprot:m51a1_g7771 putative proteasome subunit beta type 4 (229) ;mRNA; r:152702-153613
MDANKRTTDPIVTGSSVVGIKYAGGVLVAADTLGSYGSMARFMDLRRLAAVGARTLVGASGEYSDWQAVRELLASLVRRDACADDGFALAPRELFTYLNRVLYARRGKGDPYWCGLVVAGVDEGGRASLGLLDMLGTAVEVDDVCATGYGLYMALPLLRAAWRPDLDEAAARKILLDAMRVLLFRDARSFYKIQVGKVTDKGVEISEPFALDTAGMWGSGEGAIKDDY